MKRVGRVETTENVDRWHIDHESIKVAEDKVLGAGKFGTVCIGSWYGTTVAVKKLHNYEIEENEDLFAKEIKVMQELHHPHIVQFLGFSSDPAGSAMIVMEFLHNGSLEDYLVKHPSTPLNLRNLWAGQMAGALAYLHNRKPNYLIHRDLKPSNFMLSPSLQCCKLGDFGVSRLFEAHFNSSEERGMSRVKSYDVMMGAGSNEEDLEQTSNVGTARYMAPEVFGFLDQSRHGDVPVTRYSVQADMFSLGMVYYFVFEGKPPRVANASNPEEHFEALDAGYRPVYDKTKAPHRKIIDLCLKQRAFERPTSRETIVLIEGLPKKRGFCMGPNPKEAELREAAEQTFERIHRRFRMETNEDIHGRVDG